MLKPACPYKEQLEKLFASIIYDDEYFFYSGYSHSHGLPKIELLDNIYQWVIVNNDDKVIGYFAYQISPETDTAMNFGLYSFDRGNPLIGYDVYHKMVELISKHRRIEWRMIDGNPVVRAYDHFCKKFSGNKVILHKVTKDNSGIYRDEHIYEILNGGR